MAGVKAGCVHLCRVAGDPIRQVTLRSSATYDIHERVTRELRIVYEKFTKLFYEVL